MKLTLPKINSIIQTIGHVSLDKTITDIYSDRFKIKYNDRENYITEIMNTDLYNVFKANWKIL